MSHTKISCDQKYCYTGISADHIKEYLQQYLEESLRVKFLNELDSHEVNYNFKSLACVPVNLSILVYVFKQSGEKLPDSWTKLHQKYVLPKLSHYSFKTYGKYKIFTKLGDLPVQIKESLEKLSKLAFYELHKNTLNLSFPKTNLKSHSTMVILYQWITLLQVKNVTYLFKKECNKNFSFFYIKVFKNLLQPGT